MAMTVVELVTGLREHGAKLWVDGDRLRCSAPPGVVTEATKAELTSRKDEIVALLRYAESLESGPRAIVPLKGDGDRPPLFGVPGHNGDVFCYVTLARHLAAGHPLLGIQPPGLDGSPPLQSVEELAAYEVGQIRRYRPRGPYLLIGFCAGGTIAFEIARQLVEQGERVPLLALVASPFPTTYRLGGQLSVAARYLARRAPYHLRRLARGSLPDSLRTLPRNLAGHDAGPPLPPGHARLAESRERVMRTTIAAIRRHSLRPFAGPVDVFLPSEAWRREGARPDLWRTAAQVTREHVNPEACEADDILMEPHVAAVAAALSARLREVDGGENG
jgi:thioesterase domain-containing protein